MSVSPPGMDLSRIQSRIDHLKAASARAHGSVNPLSAAQPTKKVDFADALKASLDSVNGAQKNAESLGQRFSVGDESVNLSDVMISQQKASIAFQATVQVRNKLVSAYHDIMAMQV